jgi:hypothetical protein
MFRGGVKETRAQQRGAYGLDREARACGENVRRSNRLLKQESAFFSRRFEEFEDVDNDRSG